MNITLDPRLETALKDQAGRQGLAPEELVVKVLREHLMVPSAVPEPRDEWERGLLEAARPWGVTLPDAALSREELYE